MLQPWVPTRCFIDGDWLDSDRRFDVIDPATGERLAQVPDLDDAEVARAIAAAARAFPAWKARAAHERAAALLGTASRMRAREQELAALITAENGKVLPDALAEVRYAASFLEWFAGEAVRAYGETVPAGRADQRIVVVPEPVGPCALITPWNFPAAMLTRKLGAALAAGCTVVAKPASQTPLSAFALAQLAHEAGVPPGVFNVITGDARRIGGTLATHPSIRKVSFTGSTEVGRLLAKQASDTLKRVSLELGGNAPFVVFDDADLERAVAGAKLAKFRGGGQTCVAASRFLVQTGVAEAFTDRMVAMCRGMKVGRGSEAASELGPLIDDAAVVKVRRLVEDAVARGARMLCGEPVRSRMVAPIVLGGVTPEMAIWKEEVFGPVVSLTSFTGEADAIAKANDTEAGLVAYVWTRDLARAARLAGAIEAGMIGVNEGLVSYAPAPFGGVKQSGYGREGSRHGLHDYQALKYVMMTLS